MLAKDANGEGKGLDECILWNDPKADQPQQSDQQRIGERMKPHRGISQAIFEQSEHERQQRGPLSSLEQGDQNQGSHYQIRTEVGNAHLGNEDELEEEREKSSSSLASLIHHYVFRRRGTRGGVEEVVKDAYSTILFSESRVKKLRCNVKAVGEQLLRGGILVWYVEGSCIRHSHPSA